MPPLPTAPPTSIPTPSASVSPTSPPSSLLTRTQKFIEENQRLILLGCAVLAATGAGYYLYSRPDKSSPSTPTAAPSKKNKKKKKKGGEKKDDKYLKNEGDRGPLLEEIQPQTVKEGGSEEAIHLQGVPDQKELEDMSESARNELGATLKDRGNKLYSKKSFQKAIECYTKAIEVSVKKVAVFYSNRAACQSFQKVLDIMQALIR